MRSLILLAAAGLLVAPATARDFYKTFEDPPSRVWKTTNHPDLKFCVITALAAKTGQASTVIDKGSDTIIIVHNWSSPVPGDDVRAIFTIKADGTIEFRGQKDELVALLNSCNNL